MKTFEQFLNEQIYTATEICDYMTEISDTPETDIPDYYIDVIKKANAKFELKTLKIDDLLAQDESLKEYVMSGEDRYEDSDYEPSWEELQNPIVVYKGEVLDGYNRTGVLYRSGEKEIQAYVSI
jgi:hypothetical protein